MSPDMTELVELTMKRHRQYTIDRLERQARAMNTSQDQKNINHGRAVVKAMGAQMDSLVRQRKAAEATKEAGMNAKEARRYMKLWEEQHGIPSIYQDTDHTEDNIRMIRDMLK